MRTSDLVSKETTETLLDLRSYTDDDLEALIDAATDEDGLIWDHTSLYTIDTVCAAYALFVEKLKFDISAIQGFRQVFDPDEIPGLVAPLEFDTKPSYRDQGIASAFEAILIRTDLGSVDASGKKIASCDIPGMMTLVRMMARNNDTGYLKKTPWSLSKLLRKTTRIGFEGMDFEEQMGQWLGRYLTVVDALLGFYRAGLKPADLDVDGFKAVHPEKAKALSIGPKIRERAESLLDLDGYLVALHTLGVVRDDIDTEFRFFQAAFEEMRELRKEDEAEADRLFAEISDGRRPHRFAQMSWGQILLLHTPAKDATGLLFRRFGKELKLIIARTPDGHVAFLPRKGASLWMQDLASFMTRKEPGQWRLMKYGGDRFLLLNGGDKRRYLIEPTRFTDKDLLHYTERYVRPAKKRK